jgi:hypothetical protein
MANTILVKRSSATDVPSSLKFGEIAYSAKSGKFFIGVDDNGTVVDIGVNNLSDVLQQLSDALANKLDTTATAADSAKLGGNTPDYYLNINHVANSITSADIDNWNTAYNLIASDSDGVIDKIQEIFDAFKGISDDGSFNLLEVLNSKLGVDSTIDGGTF